MSELLQKPIFLYHQCIVCEKDLPENYKFKICSIRCKTKLRFYVPRCLFCRHDIIDMKKKKKWFCDWKCGAYHRGIRIQLYGK